MAAKVIAQKNTGRRTEIEIPWLGRRKTSLQRRKDFVGQEGRIIFKKVRVGNRVRNFAVKKFYHYFAFELPYIVGIEKHLKRFEQLRAVPELRPFVLPTVRRLIGRRRELLITDLTQGGKFIVTTGGEILNYEGGSKKFWGVLDLLKKNGFVANEYALVGQIDPVTKRCVKVWIADFGSVYKRKK